MAPASLLAAILQAASALTRLPWLWHRWLGFARHSRMALPCGERTSGSGTEREDRPTLLAGPDDPRKP